MKINSTTSGQEKTHAIVLAAGLSSRFESGNKLLHPLMGKPLLLHAVDTLLASLATQVIVISGSESSSIESSLCQYDSMRVRIVHNTDYTSGMASSIKVGVRAIPATDNGLIFLADMPMVSSETINKLIHAAHADNDSYALVPTYDGQDGNPVLFKPKSYASLLSLVGDKGAKSLIKKHSDHVKKIARERPGHSSRL